MATNRGIREIPEVTKAPRATGRTAPMVVALPQPPPPAPVPVVATPSPAPVAAPATGGSGEAPAVFAWYRPPPVQIVPPKTTRTVIRDSRQPQQVENGAHACNLVQYMHYMASNPDYIPLERNRCLMGISNSNFEGAGDMYGNLMYLDTLWKWKVLAGIATAEQDNETHQQADNQAQAQAAEYAKTHSGAPGQPKAANV